MVDFRILSNSITFSGTADTWAKARGLLDVNNDPVSTFPSIIGMPDGSVSLGAFNYNIIPDNRTIKQAFQDIETDLVGRFLVTNNLSELTNKPAARTNLGLGSAATWNVGTTGAVVPLLNTANTFSANQKFTAGLNSTLGFDVAGPTNTNVAISILIGTSKRWGIGTDGGAESGTLVGSNFRISKYDNTGTLIGSVVDINRNTGAVILSTPLPVASGGTGANSLSGIKTSIGLGNVDNTSDANKPISTATQAAIDARLSTAGGTVTGALRAGTSTGNEVQMTTDGSIEITHTAGFPYIDFKNNISEDYDLRIMANIAGSFFDVSGGLSSSSFVRGTQMVVTGGSSEGGQIVLADKLITGITGQANSTWNIDVDGSNVLRIFRQTSTGSVYPPALSIAETGTVTVTGLVTNQTATLGIKSSSSSSVNTGTNAFTSFNENTIPVGTVASVINTDGSASLQLSVTAPGIRTADRRSIALTVTNTAAMFAVPPSSTKFMVGSNASIEDGGVTNALTIKGQTTATSGYIQFGNATSYLGCAAGSILTYGGNTVWHAGNDGSGSGLDADTIRGINPTTFLRNTADSWITDSNGQQRLNFVAAGATTFKTATSHIWKSSTDATIATLTATGDLTTSGNITAFSDIRLKTNPTTIKNALGLVEKLRGVRYTRDGREEVGVIAQEVQCVLPEVVHATDTERQYLSVAYGNMVSVLIEAVKEMSSKINVLESKLAALGE